MAGVATESLDLGADGHCKHLHNVAIIKAEAGAQRIFRLESEMNELYVLANTTHPILCEICTDRVFAQEKRERQGPVRAHFPEAQSEDARDPGGAIYSQGRQRWVERGDQEVEAGLGGCRPTPSCWEEEEAR